MKRLTIEMVVEKNDYKVEDSGQVVIITLENDDGFASGQFVRLQSWYESGADHPDWIKNAVGKKFKITVEEVPVEAVVNKSTGMKQWPTHYTDDNKDFYRKGFNDPNHCVVVYSDDNQGPFKLVNRDILETALSEAWFLEVTSINRKDLEDLIQVKEIE